MSKIKHFIEQSWLLIVASFCFGLLIAIANAAWSPRIEQNKTDKLNHLTAFLLPQAKHFIKLDAKIEVESDKGKKTEVQVYKAVSKADKCVGWAFNAAGQGFGGKIELVIAVNENFETIAGFDVLISNETPGIGDQIKLPYFRNQFVGAPAEKLELVRTGDAKKIDNKIVAISGATFSSEDVVEIFNKYIENVKEQLQAKGFINNGK